MNVLPVGELAQNLETARLQGSAINQLTLAHPALSLEAAYRIQDEGIQLRSRAGDPVVGYKMGLTSKAKMRQMGVETPIMGVLTKSMRLASGATFAVAGLIHPRIEPEVAFVLGKELRGTVGTEEALAACSGVYAAMEIIDSRFRDFRFTLPDVIADNCSSCAFVLGAELPAAGLDVGRLKIDLIVNGKVSQTGSSEAIYGHPAAALAELSAMLAAQGKHLPAGSIVLAGAATQAVALEPGEVKASVERLGDVSLRVR